MNNLDGLPMITSLEQLQGLLSARQKSYGSLKQFLRSRENMVHKSSWQEPVHNEEGEYIGVNQFHHTYNKGKNRFKKTAKEISVRFGLTLSQAKKLLQAIADKNEQETANV